jgi:hypothetical protein
MSKGWPGFYPIFRATDTCGQQSAKALLAHDRLAQKGPGQEPDHDGADGEQPVKVQPKQQGHTFVTVHDCLHCHNPSLTEPKLADLLGKDYGITMA